jgi:hypothetical protein
MQKESDESDYIIINNFKVFVGLPVIWKSTMSLKRTVDKTENVIELKHNEKFEVIEFNNKILQIKITD